MSKPNLLAKLITAIVIIFAVFFIWKNKQQEPVPTKALIPVAPLVALNTAELAHFESLQELITFSADASSLFQSLDTSWDKDNTPGKYSANLSINSNWLDKQVHLQISASQTPYSLRLNNQLVAATHSGGKTTRVDISRLLQPEDNLFELELDTIGKAGLASEIPSAYLQAVNSQHIQDIHIETEPRDGTKFHALDVKATLHNAADSDFSGSVSFALIPASTKLKQTPNSHLKKYSLKLEAQQGSHISMRGLYPNARNWSSEQPYFYRLIVTLKDESEKIIDSVFQNMSFNNITEIDSSTVFSGVQYSGATKTATNAAFFQQLKQHNINAVFLSQQATAAFYDLADQFGIMIIEKINTGTKEQLYKNNPSLTAWAGSPLPELHKRPVFTKQQIAKSFPYKTNYAEQALQFTSAKTGAAVAAEAAREVFSPIKIELSQDTPLKAKISRSSVYTTWAQTKLDWALTDKQGKTISGQFTMPPAEPAVEAKLDTPKNYNTSNIAQIDVIAKTAFASRWSKAGHIITRKSLQIAPVNSALSVETSGDIEDSIPQPPRTWRLRDLDSPQVELHDQD